MKSQKETKKQLRKYRTREAMREDCSKERVVNRVCYCRGMKRIDGELLDLAEEEYDDLHQSRPGGVMGVGTGLQG